MKLTQITQLNELNELLGELGNIGVALKFPSNSKTVSITVKTREEFTPGCGAAAAKIADSSFTHDFQIFVQKQIELVKQRIRELGVEVS